MFLLSCLTLTYKSIRHIKGTKLKKKAQHNSALSAHNRQFKTIFNFIIRLIVSLSFVPICLDESVKNVKYNTIWKSPCWCKNSIKFYSKSYLQKAWYISACCVMCPIQWIWARRGQKKKTYIQWYEETWHRTSGASADPSTVHWSLVRNGLWTWYCKMT